MDTTTAPIALLDPTAIQYDDDAERTQYAAKNAAFCAAFNAHLPVEVLIDFYGVDKSVRGALYYALVRLADGQILPFPLFEQAAGVEFNPPMGAEDDAPENWEFDTVLIREWFIAHFPNNTFMGVQDLHPVLTPEQQAAAADARWAAWQEICSPSVKTVHAA